MMQIPPKLIPLWINPMSENQNEIGTSKRSFLKLLVGGAATFAAGSVLSPVSSDIVKRTKEIYIDPLIEDVFPSDLNVADALKVLLSNRMPAVPINQYNLRSVFVENKPLCRSIYVERSTYRLTSQLLNFPDYTRTNCVLPNNLEINDLGNAIHLAGPFANIGAGKLLGYDFNQIDSKHKNLTIPTLQDSSRLRFAVSYGEGSVGVFKGKQFTGKRFERGKIVKRARYAIYDRDSENLLITETNRQGFVTKEYFQIIRLKF